jgi:hypothetical protein
MYQIVGRAAHPCSRQRKEEPIVMTLRRNAVGFINDDACYQQVKDRYDLYECRS